VWKINKSGRDEDMQKDPLERTALFGDSLVVGRVWGGCGVTSRLHSTHTSHTYIYIYVLFIVIYMHIYIYIYVCVCVWDVCVCMCVCECVLTGRRCN